MRRRVDPLNDAASADVTKAKDFLRELWMRGDESHARLFQIRYGHIDESIAGLAGTETATPPPPPHPPRDSPNTR
ncbi:hypothetical protein EYF80_044179 [Liparis tanakae]|uniref:Uncharacterized protein n=1 Tax=Liparis tanakae TaxID=230148 RepID=A0A4Z2FY19_9TELE|nr:hypothetical protein EYF80_044179 [Liparis tanakae]